MVFKIKVSFDSPIDIIGNDDLQPITNGMTVEMTPFQNVVIDPHWTTTEPFNTYWNSITSKWTFVPSTVKINNGSFPNVNGNIIISFPEEIDLLHRFVETYKFIYNESPSNKRISRLDVTSRTTSQTEISVAGVMIEENGVLKSKIPPQLLSGDISTDNPNDIVFKFTSNRSINVYDSNGNHINDPSIGDLFGTISITEPDVYAADSTGGGPLSFGYSDINIDNDNKTITLLGGLNSARLTENSVITFDGGVLNEGAGQDEFKFKMISADNIVIENNIVNPKLFGFISSDSNKDGYLILRLSKDEGNSFIDNFDYSNSNQVVEECPHNHITLSSTPNPYTNLGNNFGLYSVDDINDVNTYFKKEGDVIKLKLNRFARSNLNYTLDYQHPTNITTGIFDTNANGDRQNAVLQPASISITNSLEPIVIDTVSEVKVFYPSSKPHHTNVWSSDTLLATYDENDDNYKSFTAYFYVDVTFKNGNTNQPVSITAKYDTEGPTLFGYQESGGHKLHHGLILNYDGNEIPEEITQTTVRDSNDNVVDLRSGANGTKLRIEFPAGDIQGGTKNAYNTSTNEPSSYSFTNSTKTLKITFDDRQEKGFDGSLLQDYYYINLMDSNGNVCLPFLRNITFPNNWGMDKFGQLPTIASAAVNVTYSQLEGWSSKKLTLTFNQDILDTQNVVIVLNKDLELGLSNQTIITGKIISDKTITYDVSDINRHDGLSVSYDKPIGENLNTDTGIYENILYNWFGFEINSFSNISVTNNLPEIPSIKDIVFTEGNGDESSFGGTLTWTLTNNSLLGFDENPVDSDKISDYTIETASTFNATTWTLVADNFDDPTTSFSINGLNNNEDIFFRIKAKTYDYGEYKVSPLVRRDVIVGFPVLSFSDLDENGQLPMLLGSTDFDVEQNSTSQQNLLNFTIYWSYKPTSGSWGGNLFSNDSTTVSTLYEISENNTPGESIDPDGGWLKLPVFWEPEDSPPDGFVAYPGTGGLPWYNAKSGTFNNVGAYHTETFDMNYPFDLKFLVFDTAQGISSIPIPTNYPHIVTHTIEDPSEGDGEGDLGIPTGSLGPGEGEGESTPDTSPPSYTSGAWYTGGVDGSTWTLVNGDNPALIPAGHYIKYTFTATDDTAVELTSGSATLKAGTTDIDNGLTLSDDDGYYISYQIPSGNTDNGVISLEFTLTDGLGNDGSQITETSAITLDSIAPAMDINTYGLPEWWYYDENADTEGEVEGESTEPTYITLDQNSTFGPDVKIKLTGIVVSEANGLSLKSNTAVVKIGNTTMNITESGDGVTIEEIPSGSGIYYVHMIYTIPDSGNGVLSFEFTLKDDAGNELIINTVNGQQWPVHEVTIDTAQPTFVSATVNAAGDAITIEYSEDLDGDTVTSNGNVGWALSNLNSDGATLTLGTLSQNGNTLEKFTFALNGGTFYAGDEISATNPNGINIYTEVNGPNIEDLAGNNPVAISNSNYNITNNSTQTPSTEGEVGGD